VDGCFCIVKGRRYRYIYFSYNLKDRDISFLDVSEVFREGLRKNRVLCFPKRVRLILFDGCSGVVRCAHVDMLQVRAIINRLVLRECGSETAFSTLGTSGTLRRLRQKFDLPKKNR
jgi:RNase P/RNase MRP subunit POP5